MQCTKRQIKKVKLQEAGITLVALVVTIIVLLILAGVTITLALSNNGVIGRAQYSSNTWANATKDEETAMGQFATDVDTLTEGFINREGDSGGDTPEETETSAIKYPAGKTGATVTTGDTISITFKEGTETYTEDFMVLSEEPDAENKIMAMPYYNITKSTTDPKQSSTQSSVWDSTKNLAFSSSAYWTDEKINIPMSGANNVQQYIDAYNKKIALVTGGKEVNGTVTGGKAEAQIGRYYNTNPSGWDISRYSNQTNSENKKLLNPSGVGNFWLGSSSDSYYNVRSVLESGNIGAYHCDGSTGYSGVRPVIKISLS